MVFIGEKQMGELSEQNLKQFSIRKSKKVNFPGLFFTLIKWLCFIS
jgi:hypothetical protein